MPETGWLYAIRDGSGYTLDGESTVEGFARLVARKRRPGEMDWGIKAGYRHRPASPGDHLFVYTGQDDRGIIGSGSVVDLIEREPGDWAVIWRLDVEASRSLIARPFPAALVRSELAPARPRKNLFRLSSRLVTQVLKWLES
jgi:hypothetical protein